MSIFEILMLVAFGISWPLSIIKTIKSKSVEGRSILFLIIIFLGYVSGTIHKLLNSNDMVLYLYIINGIMVLTDLVLVLYKKNKAKN